MDSHVNNRTERFRGADLLTALQRLTLLATEQATVSKLEPWQRLEDHPNREHEDDAKQHRRIKSMESAMTSKYQHRRIA